MKKPKDFPAQIVRGSANCVIRRAEMLADSFAVDVSVFYVEFETYMVEPYEEGDETRPSHRLVRYVGRR